MQATVVIIGAGQAGLAMSHCLTGRGVDHILLEQGTVAHAWRTQRWDSLRLLTPNWMTRLPGFSYRGGDPDGYLTAAGVAHFLDGYRRSFDAPVRHGTRVTEVRRHGSGFVVETDQGSWQCRAVVVATGATGDPHRPALGAELPGSVEQLSMLQYRRPGQIGTGGVLVVGASASGVQIADELARSGREVTLAVGEHLRMPRTYRGRDIHYWMDAIGQLDERYDQIEDIARARRLPSLQLVGSPERRTLDLNSLSGNGVQLVGRLVGVTGGRVQFSGGLANQVAAADLKQNRLLDRVDDFIAAQGGAGAPAPGTRPAPTVIGSAPTVLNLDRFGTVVWATGYRPRYPWLDPALLDRRGGIRHDGGVMSVPGMYVLGLPFTRRRKSNFIDGVGPDARDLSALLINQLEPVTAAAA